MKKLAAILLAFALVMTAVLVPILAEGDTVTTVGYSGARVKKANLTNVVNIKDYDVGNRQYAYKITDPEGLVKLSTLVNTGVDSFEKVYIYLAKDLDMSGVSDFAPIGRYGFRVTSTTGNASDGSSGGVQTVSFIESENFPFEGNFNGHGHIIENLVMNIDSTKVVYGGLFGYVSGSTITNLILGEGSRIEYAPWNNYGASGSVIGKAIGNVKLDNVYNLADVNVNAFEKLAANPRHSFGPHAAMIGRGFATITNCTNAGDMSSTNSSSGFIGYAELGTTTIKNCRNTGTITAIRAGGMAARSSAPLVIENCINNGAIYGTGFVGGILGQFQGSAVTIKNCTNYGALAALQGYSSVTIASDGITHCPSSGASVYTNQGNISKIGQTDPTLATDLETPVFDDLEDTTGGETAFTTPKGEVSTEEYVIPNNPTPTGNEVGYSSARVQAVDTSDIPNIKSYWDTEKVLEAYKITDVEGWYYFDALLYEYNLFRNVTIYLANDLDFENKEGYQPISFDDQTLLHINAASLYYFGGTFDGLGHQICNLKMHTEFDGYDLIPGTQTTNSENVAVSALFGYSKGATFKNLIIDDSCYFTIESGAQNPVTAGLCAIGHNITVDNVWNQATCHGGRFAGGIIARAAQDSYETLINVTNTGSITASQCAGGMIGYANTGIGVTTITNCRNVGMITRLGSGVTPTDGAAGFIARCLGVTEIVDSINNGDIIASANIGSFVAIAGANVTIKNSANYGFLRDANKTGRVGFVAYNAASSVVVNLDSATVDRYGEVDESLTLELELPVDFTPNHGNTPVTTTSVTQQTTLPGITTEATVSGETTTAPATTVTDTQATSASTEQEGGCKSTVVGSFALIVLIFGAALTVCKKKDR